MIEYFLFWFVLVFLAWTNRTYINNSPVLTCQVKEKVMLYLGACKLCVVV